MKKLISVILALVLMLGCAAAESGAMKLTAPAGAPALAVATLAAENPENYTFVAADTIGAEFAKNETDFIIAPINAGAKLFKAGKSTYRLAAVVTWGNLYIASQKADFTLESLNGAEVTLFGENTINASVVLAVLEAKGIQPAAVSYLSGAAETQAELLSNPEAIVVTADPAVTAAKIKNENVKTISVQELLKEAFGTDGYAQAGLFVRADTLAADEAGVKAFLDAVKDAAGKAETDVKAMAEAAVKLEILPNAKVAEAAIPGCSIRFTPAAEAREAIEKTAAFDLSQYGGEVPADEFYYTGE
jgi:NitT/TauT family transport system substrate-binding protein